MTKIKIADLDLSLQTREGTDAETINNYAEAMADGAAFPEVTVFTDGRTYWLADGFHRVMAMRQNGKATIAADVRKGTADDAVVFGGTANNRQGKRPTRADVQHFLAMVWERREAIFGGTPTGGNLAAKCGVSVQTGNRFVQERLAEMPPMPPRPTMPMAQLPKRNAPGGTGAETDESTMPMAQLEAPARPTKLIGANGREYPVRPTAPARPAAPVRRMPRDRYGTEIPVEIQAAFETDALGEVLSHVSKARSILRREVEGGNIAFGAVRQEVGIQLDNAYAFAKAGLAHCVCRMCQGTGCKACHLRGWQTEEEYKRNPKEFQAE